MSKIQRIKRLISLFMTVIIMNTAFSSLTIVKAETNTGGSYMENLDRGLVAMISDNGVYLSWRLLGTEAYDTTFDVYRDGVKIASDISDSTDYFDEGGKENSAYRVVSSNETADAAAKTVSPFESGDNYIEIPVAPIEEGLCKGRNSV